MEVAAVAVAAVAAVVAPVTAGGMIVNNALC